MDYHNNEINSAGLKCIDCTCVCRSFVCGSRLRGGGGGGLVAVKHVSKLMNSEPCNTRNGWYIHHNAGVIPSLQSHGSCFRGCVTTVVRVRLVPSLQ
jgi:hypothetical protein